MIRQIIPLSNGPAIATRRCSLERGTNVGPTRLPSGQRCTSSWSQSSQAAIAACANSWTTRAMRSSPSQHAVWLISGSRPFAARVTADQTNRITRKRISKMWTRTAVPNHRPRLIGDHVKGSFMAGHPGWMQNPRTSRGLGPHSDSRSIGIGNPLTRTIRTPRRSHGGRFPDAQSSCRFTLAAFDAGRNARCMFQARPRRETELVRGTASSGGRWSVLDYLVRRPPIPLHADFLGICHG